MVAEVLKGLGRTCAALGRADEAEKLLVESIRTREASTGPDHPEVGKTLTLLGVFYLDQGRTSEAASVLGRARRILDATLTSDHPAMVELRAARDRLPGTGAAATPVARTKQ